MKRLTLTLVFAFAAMALMTGHGMGTNAGSRLQGGDFGLPELHKIKAVTLSPSYSCRPGGGGYENAALFLSTFSLQLNAPDLLFNGACGAEDYFQASTAGDDMALIADLGRVPLEEVTAQRAFNLSNVFTFSNFSAFAQVVPIKKKHTYAVLLNKQDIRGLFLFTVTAHVQNQSVDLRYAVKEYQILNRRAESPGFDWGKPNS